MLKFCARYGVDPVAVAELSARAGKSTMAEIQDAIPGLSGAADISGKGIFSPWCPQQPIFGDFELSDETGEWWERRQAVAYIFGIHPLFAVMSPELTEENMLELAEIGTESDLDQNTLDDVIKFVCG
jgi:aldehyde:ferredoxin oxidoreductase